MAARITSIVIMVAIATSCHHQAHLGVARIQDRRITNLHAFARMYGVVRWFHPSDAAAAADWDRIAVDGVRRVIDVSSREALKDALRDTFAPVAPTIQIASVGESFTSIDEHKAPFDLIAWQHLGYGDSGDRTGYASKRRHRDLLTAADGVPYMTLWQSVDATPLRGKRIRLRGQLRTAGHGLGRLWMRVDRGDQHGFLDTMIERPIISAGWVAAEIVGPVAADATRVLFGPIKDGPGTVWYDELQLDVQRDDGGWTPIAIDDPGFESSSPLVAWKPGRGRTDPALIAGWSLSTDASKPASGRAALRIEPTMRIERHELFDALPSANEVTDIDLGDELRARVPLTLYSRGGHTPAPQRAMPISGSFDRMTGIAGVIIVWNVLEHFWPYWNVVSIDWLTELDTALGEALTERNIDQHVETLEHLTAALPDAHAWVRCLGTTPTAQSPFAADLIQGAVIVTATNDPSLQVGDEIVSIDGNAVTRRLTELQRRISGSPRWRMHRAIEQLGEGPEARELRLRVRREREERELAIHRNVAKYAPIPRTPYQPITRLDDGVYYVDLARAAMADLNPIMNELASAPGIVFDMRARPLDTDGLVSYLLTHDVMSNAFATPQIIRPDHTPRSIAGWAPSAPTLSPRAPHLGGRVAFIADVASASYPETLLGVVHGFHLAEIVGSSTAGTNGDIADILEPSGCKTQFTGLRTLHEDGSTFHLIGIPPTIPAARTVAGVRSGRDELLEKALDYVRTGVK